MSEPTGGIRRSQFSRESILNDYRLGHLSRQASYLGRREVLTGKAKFGIFGDGKEVAQLAMARAFRPGDWRSGYYRDQTFMFAVGALTLEQYFAQLYADPDPEREPCSAGRQMNAHFATRLLDAGGEWLDLTGLPNSSSDISPTAAQMPRLVGLGYASRIFRCRPDLAHLTYLSRGGDEIAFGTIGDASCAEGLFWEAINAAAVVQAPVLLSIWDNGYGISVPIEYQLAKGSLTEVLAGFQRDKGGSNGIDLYRARGWDYPALCETYLQAAEGVRREHVPAIVHVPELTQPQGHSTSGSHERYKSKERLAWEKEYDCLVQMRSWLLAEELAGDEELRRLEEEAKEAARAAQRRAWEAFQEPLREERRRFAGLARGLAATSPARERISAAVDVVERHDPVQRRQLLATAAELLVATRGESAPARDALAAWYDEQAAAGRALYSTHLHSTSSRSPLATSAVAPVYASPPETVNGYEVLNACFDAAMARVPEFLAFGEDVGALGDVNQGFMGLQEKYGLCRVTDTGIREATIVGQAIGLALRGLRPLAEIQYLDYLLYALQILADDLATLRYRTAGGQQAPVIVRTRGHRLEGIWHSGSPLAGILGLVRGIWVCVPRDMTRAAAFYNTLLAGDDPGIVVEVLNGYRLKEQLPVNIGEIRLPLGVPEVLRSGRDATVVTYGACCRIALEAAELLAEAGIDAEVIDVQTLLPFDREGVIGRSLQKTHRVLFLDEDVPGGATAYMMRQVLEEQGAFWWLDAPPRTLTGAAHRPAFGSDGDYFSKPNRESVFAAVEALVRS